MRDRLIKLKQAQQHQSLTLRGTLLTDAWPEFAGALGYWDDHAIEYDLSPEDKAWLADFNQGQNRLAPRRLELLLWQLEVCNSAATDQALVAAGERHMATTIQAQQSAPVSLAWCSLFPLSNPTLSIGPASCAWSCCYGGVQTIPAQTRPLQ